MEDMAKEKKNGDAVDLEVGKPAAPTVDWDDSEMRSTYANVVNASSTREEVTLLFGTNQTWNPGADRKFKVKLQDRIRKTFRGSQRRQLHRCRRRFRTIQNVDGITRSTA